MTTAPRVIIRADLGATERAAWHALAADDFYASYQWLRLVAADPDAEPGFALASDAEIMAGLPFARVHREANSFYQWRELMADRGITAAPGSRLLLGTRRGYQTRLLTTGSLTTRGDETQRVDAVVRALIEELTGQARGAGSAGALAMYADTAMARRLHDEVPSATVLHLATDAWIDLPGADFGDYLASLGGHRRRRVRHELNAFAAADLRWEHRVLADASGDAGRLLAATQRRYGHFADPQALAQSLARQGAMMGDAAEVLLLHHGQRVVGFVSFYCHGDVLYLRAAGFDYPALVGAAEYFNLVYYLPIRLAYQRGLRRVHAGIEAAEAKALRGARLCPLWLIDLATAEQEAASEYNANVLAGLLAAPALRQGVDPTQWLPFSARRTVSA